MNKLLTSIILILISTLIYFNVKLNNIKKENEYNKSIAEANMQNYKASIDSVKTYKSKNNSLISEISSYRIDIVNQYEDYNKLLKKYRNELNLSKSLKEVNSLISAQLEIKDSIIANTSFIDIDSNNRQINISMSDTFSEGNYRTVLGQLNVYKDSVSDAKLNITQGVKLKAAIINDNGLDVIRISTNYPNLEITDIENINNININPVKQKNIHIGIVGGYGLALNSHSPFVGLGIMYSPNWLSF